MDLPKPIYANRNVLVNMCIEFKHMQTIKTFLKINRCKCD